MVYVTGDTHSNIDWDKLRVSSFPEQKKMTRDDVVIIAGDFGAPWCNPEDRTDKMVLNWYEHKKFTTLYVDGNHENFEALLSYPETEYAGAKCQKIRPHVLHIRRGEVLHLCGHKIWCMGGASSHDKEYRIEHISWWKQEEPSEAEWRHAEETLLREKPDIIITHEAPARLIAEESRNLASPVARAFERIAVLIEENHIPVTNWFFGHHHMDAAWKEGKITYCCLYHQVIRIL
jgi:predicted phosphodiesterase